MADARDGMNYAPEMGGAKPVVQDGEFVFAGACFDHGHIYGQIEGLAAAGGSLKYVYDPDPSKYESVLKQHPGAKAVSDLREILDDDAVQMVTSAAIPSDRGPLGMQVLDAGKDYFTDKSPFTTLEQLEQARQKTAETGQKYMVSYSERLGNECAWYAGELIEQGAIGRVLQVVNLAPHNLAAERRPGWFFEKDKYGGILTDIGSHQFEQFLTYAGATDATVNFARVDNLDNPEYRGLEDFGEASLTMDNGASGYCRLDWFNPGGSKTWGDGRTFVLGTTGYLELRKNIDVGTENGGNRLILVDEHDTHVIECQGKVGFPFFGKLILDCLNRTELAMTQAHAFKAAEISMKAQAMADAARGAV